jgi:hypothetical protein
MCGASLVPLRCRVQRAALLPSHLTGGTMSKILRGVAAGWGAKKLGGGCFTTVLVFVLLWWLLGNIGVFQ